MSGLDQSTRPVSLLSASASASGDLAAVSQGESDDSCVSDLDLEGYSKVAYSVRDGEPSLLWEILMQSSSGFLW